MSFHCTTVTVDMLGYAVDSLYPNSELNTTIREVFNIELL